MEDFFDYFLGLLLAVLIGSITLLIYFSFHAPLLAYFLAVIILVIFAGGTAFFVWRIIQKKQLEHYYPLLQSMSQSYKDIKKALRKLDRPTRISLKPILPKIKKAQKTTRKHIWKLCAIDKTLLKLDQQQPPDFSPHQSLSAQDKQARMITYHTRYYEHIRAIEASKTQYLQEIQEALQCLHSLHAQLLAVQYSPNNTNLAGVLSEILDDLLIEMEALRETEEVKLP